RSHPTVPGRLGPEPAFGDDLLARVEGHGVGAVGVQVAEKGLLPAAEREEGHGRRHAQVDAEHAGLDALAEGPRRRPRLREHRHPRCPGGRGWPTPPASPRSAPRRTLPTGPKIPPRATNISGVTPSRTVGPTKQPRGRAGTAAARPSSASRAPSASPRSTAS